MTTLFNTPQELFENLSSLVRYKDDETFQILLKHLADDHMDASKWRQYEKAFKEWTMWSHPEDCGKSYDMMYIKYHNEVEDWKKHFQEFIKSF